MIAADTQPEDALRWRNVAGFSLAVLLLHVALTQGILSGTPDPVVASAKVPPIEIELTKPPPPPPEIKPEPPKPLPQKPQVKKPVVQKPVIQQPVAQPTPQPVQEPVHEPVATEPVGEVVAPPAPPAPPAPAPKAEEPVTEATGYAGYLRNPPPEYPAFAQRQGWEGKVLLKVHVLANGTADKVNILQSSGRKALDEAAVRAVNGWAFVPSKRGQTPIDGWATVPIEFRLGK